jgi:hypothetical protein
MNGISYSREQLVSFLNNMNNIKRNQSSTGIVYMSADFFASTVNSAFQAGAYWVLFNIEGSSSYEESILKGVLNMSNEISNLTSMISELDKKYDSKVDKLADKISEVGQDVADIKKDIAVINKQYTHIEEKLDKIDKRLSSRSDWWLKYVLPPVFSGIVVGIVMLFIGKLFQ